MSNFEQAEIVAKTTKALYEDAYAAYITAQPGRDLTIKQGHMHTCKVALVAALMNFFDEYEKSGVL